MIDNLSITIKTNIGKDIQYKPSMTDPTTTESKVYFNPLVKYNSISFKNTFINASLFQSLMNSYKKQPRISRHIKGNIDNNILVTLNSLFPTYGIIYIEREPYVILDVLWRKGDWKIGNTIYGANFITQADISQPRQPNQPQENSSRQPDVPNSKSLYSILGVNRNATDREIKLAYKKSRMYNPDKLGKSSQEIMKAQRRFQEINNANNILTDPTLKRDYDKYLEDHPEIQNGGSQNGSQNTCYITIYMELQKGKVTKEQMENMTCHKRWNALKKSFADFTGTKFRLPIMVNTRKKIRYNPSNKTRYNTK